MNYLFRTANPMASACTDDELKSLQEKRAEAIRKAGTKWLLHPANNVKRKTPMLRPVLAMFAFIMLMGIGNVDCDGRCPAPRAEASP